MTSSLVLLINRLNASGVSPDLIPGFIRDVVHIIGGGGWFTAELVNAMLEELGWEQELLDETTFQLIVYILETEWGYRVRHYSMN